MLAGTDAAGEAFTLARVISATFLPCFALDWSLPSGCAKQQSQSQMLGKLWVGTIAALQTLLHWWCLRGIVSGYSALGEQPRQPAPFVPLHCHIGKKIGSDSYCSFPSSLGREMVLVVTAKPAISRPSSFGGKTQREGCWILLH